MSSSARSSCCSAAALLVGILWLGKTDYRGVYDRYEASMRESVAGLSVDSRSSIAAWTWAG